MQKARTIIGLVAGLMLVLSSAAHSFMGWPVLRAKLAATTAPAELTTGLGLGWNFAGAAMLAMGIVVLHIFVGRLRAVPRSTFAAGVIGVLYLAYGCYALAVARDPFFIGVFVLPGVLLLVAASGSNPAAGAIKLEE